jgi:hypothetical protein
MLPHLILLDFITLTNTAKRTVSVMISIFNKYLHFCHKY